MGQVFGCTWTFDVFIKSNIAANFAANSVALRPNLGSPPSVQPTLQLCNQTLEVLQLCSLATNLWKSLKLCSQLYSLAACFATKL
jgi:hypothetical protein